MERSNGIGEGEVIFLFNDFEEIAGGSEVQRCAPAGLRACPETRQEGSDEEAQAAPCGKLLLQVIFDYRKIATLDRDKAVK